MASKVVSLSKRGERPRAVRAGKPRARKATSSADMLTALRARIGSHEVAPGAKLGENDLAEEFGVPRTRVREVLSALEQRGLVERIPNRGAVVTRMEMAQLVHIYQVREVLEGLCARLATRNVPQESWQDLLDAFKGPMAAHIRAERLDEYIAGYEAFRRRILDAAANPLLAEMLDSIFEKTQVLIRRTIILPGRAETGRHEHIAVLEAMRRGDADEAERLRRANMRSALAYVERYQKFLL